MTHLSIWAELILQAVSLNVRVRKQRADLQRSQTQDLSNPRREQARLSEKLKIHRTLPAPRLSPRGSSPTLRWPGSPHTPTLGWASAQGGKGTLAGCWGGPGSETALDTALLGLVVRMERCRHGSLAPGTELAANTPPVFDSFGPHSPCAYQPGS